MMKHLTLAIVLACFVISPLMAKENKRGQGKQARGEKHSQLSQEQSQALKKYQSALKAHREANKADKEANMAEHRELKAQMKAAFVKGDFQLVETLKNEQKQKLQARKQQNSQVKIKAMQDAFGNLSDEDRAAVADIVLKNRKRGKKYAKGGGNRQNKQ